MNDCDHSWQYIGSKRQVMWQCSKCNEYRLDNPNHIGKQMIDARKLQYYTMAHRMRGFAEGIIDQDRHEALVHMLMKAAMLLEEAWDDYQLTLPEDQRVGS